MDSTASDLDVIKARCKLEFNPHAREDTLALVAEVERLRERLRQMKASLDHEVDSRVRAELEAERNIITTLTAEYDQLEEAFDAGWEPERLRARRAEAETEQLRRLLHDERVRRDEWEKMHNRLVSGTELFVGTEIEQFEIEQLQAKLAVIDEALGEFSVADSEDRGVYRLQAELDRVRQDAQDQSDEVQELWLSPCEAEGLRRQLAQAVVAQADAELAAHVHDKSCGELAQTVHTERALRREAEQRAKGALATARKRAARMGEAERRANKAVKQLIRAGEREHQSEQRAERAEAELERGHRTLTQLGVSPDDGNDKLTMRIEQMIRNERARCTERAKTTLADCGIGGIYDTFNDLPDAIEQMSDYIREIDGRLDRWRKRGRQAMALAAMVTPGLAELLERLGRPWDVPPATLNDRMIARALAARIREALGETGNEAL